MYIITLRTMRPFHISFLLGLFTVMGCSTKTLDEMTASQIFSDSQVLALARAAETGDVKKIDELVKTGVDVNARGRGNVTPLLRSYLARNFEGFDCLLKHGANPNLLDEAGSAVVLLASQDKDSQYLRRALECGGNSNLVNTGNRYSKNSTPLLYAIGLSRVENVKLLADAGADCNRPDGIGRTPLSSALEGKWDIAIVLIKAGADIHTTNRFGNTAVDDVKQGGWAIETPADKQAFRDLIKLMNSMGENIPPYEE